MVGLFAEMRIFETGITVVPMLSLFFSAYDFAYMPLFIAYPSEVLPFQLQANGLAITLTMDGLACFFNRYINPSAFAALKWCYFSVYRRDMYRSSYCLLFLPRDLGPLLGGCDYYFRAEEVRAGGQASAKPVGNHG